MRLYFKHMKLCTKSAMQYKKSFILSLISQIFVVFTYYFTIIALFDKFGNLDGYTVYDVLLTFSIVQIGFSFNETFFRGIDKFDELIINGGYDRLLVKPRSILLQLMAQQIDLIKASRLIQGIIVLVIALVNLDIVWNINKVITLILMIISSIVLFFSIFLLSASYCFFTVQALEVRNLIADGGKHMAQYPIGIFRKGFVFIFTFIIPYGFVNYYPLLYFIGKVDNVLYGYTPILVGIFLFIAMSLFNRFSKRYLSCGS